MNSGYEPNDAYKRLIAAQKAHAADEEYWNGPPPLVAVETPPAKRKYTRKPKD